MTTAKRKKPKDVDIDGQREEFLQTFFRKGAELTQDLLRENERLRYREAELSSEVASLRRHLDSKGHLAELLGKLEVLEEQRRDLVARFEEAQQISRRYNERYAQIERELAEIASLYVASHQLHSTLDVRNVVRHIRELLHQLVGAKAFAVYLADAHTRELGVIISAGIDRASLPSIAAGAGPIGKAFATGETYVAESMVGPVGPEAPLACVPLRVDERVVGAIAVFELLPQKGRFEPVDFELFKLLGAHAATALVGARLYSRLAGKALTLDEYLDLV
ncbi:MAG: GAF domain-containing protein [Deltaproteobacteria bacterium]|nr:GAF domain-containing protein [Deltaproteobacteria bacterium]